MTIKNIPTSEINAFVETVNFSSLTDPTALCKRIREYALEDFASEVFAAIIERIVNCGMGLPFLYDGKSYCELFAFGGVYNTFCQEFGPIEHEASSKLKAAYMISNYFIANDKDKWLSDKGINRMTISRLAARNGIDLKEFGDWVQKSSRNMFAELFESKFSKGLVCNQDPKRRVQSFTYDEKEDWTQSTFEIKGITPELAKEIQALLIGTIKRVD